MKKIKMVFASANAGKTAEMKLLVNKYLNGFDVELLGLDDVGFTEKIIEYGTTFEENAKIKAQAVFKSCGMICFADDSGLCVDYLNGAPGVYTSDYGGIDKLLHELAGVPDGQRTARFCCALHCVVSHNAGFCVTGECHGVIARGASGEDGFGYDPVFYYPPLGRTFAQLNGEEKNNVSHRAAAAELFAEKIVEYI